LFHQFVLKKKRSLRSWIASRKLMAKCPPKTHNYQNTFYFHNEHLWQQRKKANWMTSEHSLILIALIVNMLQCTTKYTVWVTEYRLSVVKQRWSYCMSSKYHAYTRYRHGKCWPIWWKALLIPTKYVYKQVSVYIISFCTISI
jgi:hypothetical protein